MNLQYKKCQFSSLPYSQIYGRKQGGGEGELIFDKKKKRQPTVSEIVPLVCIDDSDIPPVIYFLLVKV